MSRGDVLVLGAGMVGVCTAWHLRQQGFDVVLIDRGPPGAETSFGNAGLIQREAVEPYAFPRQWRKILAAALDQGVDIHYHLSALPALAPALWRYFRLSRPDRHALQSQAYSRLIACALDDHQPLIAQAGAEPLITRSGYRLPLFAKRGYHQHYAAGDRLQLPLLDAERGYVLAPMRRGMRLTTGAEFAQLHAPATPVQIGRALAAARELVDLREPLDDPPA